MKHISKLQLSGVLLSAYLLKLLIVAPSFADALVLLSVTSLHGFISYIHNKNLNTVPEKVQSELDVVRSQLSSMLIKNAKPAAHPNMGTKF